MTTHPTHEPHPSDLELAAWWDDPATAPVHVGEHVAGCERCRAEIHALDETRALLGADPPMPGASAFAAQRERIRAAAAPRRSGRRSVPRVVWLAPLAAAASVAAIVLVGRTGGGGEEVPIPDAETAVRLPVVAEAAAAAEEAALTVVPEGPPGDATVVPAEAVAAEPIDEEQLDAALAATEPLAPPVGFERTLETEALFADLPEAEQSAILVELASADLGL